MYPEIYNPSIYHHTDRWRRGSSEDVFTCRQCNSTVYTQPVISGVQNRNHCPYCLWSRHVDQLKPGDRMSACKASMQPIGLTVKRRLNKYKEGMFGELMLIHRCCECGKLSINRIAADDQVERLMEIFYSSSRMDTHLLDQVEKCDIHLLQAEDAILVTCQLRGYHVN